MNHILIVDDDIRILKLLKKFLSQNGYLVSTSSSPSEAAELISNFVYDLIILDVMMPEITGLEFAAKIKNSGAAMPIIMLTALSEPDDRVKGLESGANDYLTKPFEPRELLLRINNLIKSHNLYKKEQQLIRFGNNSYNLVSKEFIQNNKTLKLSSSEEKLIDILIDAKNQVVSRDDLAKKMGAINPRSIDVQIVRLRGKIEVDSKAPKFLKTIRNKGYVLYA